ncbi:Cochaperone prefoldin complex subunit [Blastocladiella emersonii ATCC 22665]|nr:Cochaperone prefoldin complex subunit [Blastocladiella emersonii ATCC 22665]
MSSSASSSSSAAAANRPSDQEIVSRFNAMRQELSNLLNKLTELEMDKEEHTQVIDTLKPLDGDRKTFRLVGGVLMERTIKEVLPALQLNLDGINDVMRQIATTYKKKEDELKAFQTKYDIRVVNQGPNGRPVAA